MPGPAPQAADPQAAHASPAKRILDHALGWNEIELCYHGQIAIRQAHNIDKPYPPKPHIDGIAAGDGRNGLAPGSEISNFTALVGVFLTKVDTEFAGNLTVWPSSHHRLEAYFRNRGRDAMREGMPEVDLGDPIQLFASPGDVVLCHYQLAHAAAVNLSANDRIAIYFRVWLKGIENRRAPGDLEFLQSHFSEEPRTHGHPGATNYRFFTGNSAILIWDQGDDEGGGAADWWLGASSDEALLDLLQRVWHCGNLRETFTPMTRIRKRCWTG